MSALDRTQRPSSGVVRSFDFPTVDRRSASNGLDLRVVKLNRLPVVSTRLFLRGGESALADDHGGLAVLAGDALDGGTNKRSGAALAEALESIGARMSVGAGWEGTSLSLSCLADRLPEALGILAETLTDPAFPEDEVARAKEQHLAGLRQRQNVPGSIADDEATRRYFAAGVPYARGAEGSVETVQPLNRDHLRGYADANHRPQGGGMVVTGDVDTQEVLDLVEEALGAWTGAPAQVADFDVTPATADRRVWIVHRPDAVQTEIRIGHVGAARATEDYNALSIANMAFGGMFTSRLNLNLREKHGFTYGIRSRFTFRSRPGPFQIGTSVSTDVTARAVEEIVSELTQMAADGPTEEEVASARDYAAGVFGLQLETAGQIATRVSQLVVYGLADDYYHEYRDRVRAVTREEAVGAAQKHMRPEELQVVLVGDAGEIRGDIEGLDLGPIEVIEPA